MPYKDFRAWIARLVDERELLRIKDRVNLEPDVGAISHATILSNGPGLLLENLAGYPSSHTLTIGLMGTFRRLALSMDLPKSSARSDLVQEMARRLEQPPIKPKRVSWSPVKEERHFCGEVNLFEFPLHRLNKHDGGPYLTKTHVIAKDPETGWINVGMYRMQVEDRAKTKLWLTMAQHGGMIFRKWEEMGKPMPAAVALGVDPALTWAAITKFSPGVNEYDVAGALRGEPLDVIPAETIDLDVPASAEVVIEGEVQPGVRRIEGPFGEFPGSYSTYRRTMVFEVKAVTHRVNPIFDAIQVGKAPSEVSAMSSVVTPSADTTYLQQRFPEVMAVVPWPSSHQVVIQGTFRRHGDARRVMLAWFSGPRREYVKSCVVVDEDVDPYDPAQVLWALAYRFQADRDLVIVPNYPSSGLDPSESCFGLTTLCGFDATKAKPPSPRYAPIGWIEPWKEVADWRKRISELWGRIDER